MVQDSGAKTRILNVRVIPGSAKPRVEQSPDGEYRVYVSEPPEKGKANASMKKALSKHLGIKKSWIAIVKGSKNRDKTIEIRLE